MWTGRRGGGIRLAPGLAFPSTRVEGLQSCAARSDGSLLPGLLPPSAPTPNRSLSAGSLMRAEGWRAAGRGAVSAQPSFTPQPCKAETLGTF